MELTYFWGLASTLQAVVTPDLSAGFLQLEFFTFVVGHLGIVVAALFLVVGLRLRPRPGSVTRVFAITAVYTALVGWFDWVTGSNYMFLAAVPRNGSLLSVLGPWPWYILSAAGVALVLLLILDAPFHHRRLLGPNLVGSRSDTHVHRSFGTVNPSRKLRRFESFTCHHVLPWSGCDRVKPADYGRS